MAGNTYNWRQSIPNTNRISEADQGLISQMSIRGRSPLFQNGRLAGFKSRPGAPMASGDSMNGLGIAGALGSQEHTSAWNAFFNPAGSQSTPAPVPTAASPINSDVASDENFGGGAPTGAPTVTADPVKQSIATNQNWFRSQGLQFPPPPTPRAPLYNPTAQVRMRALPGNLTGPMGNAASDAANLSQNQALYAPGGLTEPITPISQGWNTTTSDQLAAIRQRYSSNNG